MVSGIDDPLWVPVLTHYRDGPEGAFDAARALSQIEHIQPSVRQFLIAGTTSDGWGMTPEVFAGWLDLLANPRLRPLSLKVMIGLLEPITEAVVDKARTVETWARDAAPAAEVVGLTVCPPVDRSASQARIVEHYEAVLAATTLPIAVYQLPQVTENEIEPETFARIAANRRVRYLKDTSGADRIALSGVSPAPVVMLRGAEGDYAAQKKPLGPYDGWLLSSANAFAPSLRTIAEAIGTDDLDTARRESARIASVVEALFRIAEAAGIDNPFSLANRIADHLNWAGPQWRSHPGPLTRTGERVSHPTLEEAALVLESNGLMPTEGYATFSVRNG